MTQSQFNVTLKQRFRYKFDNLMSRGPVALIGWLGVLSLILVICAGVIISIAELSQEDSAAPGFIEAAWESLMRTLDPGTMGGDTGWGFRIVMLTVTLGGIFMVSTLIGILSAGISSKLDQLRRGHSFVIEKGHTLILGWSEKIFTIISELVIANENQKDPCIVILANREKIGMEENVSTKIPQLKNTRIICRSGSTIDLDDLKIVNPHQARSIIILSEEESEPDIHVIKTILAITNDPGRKPEPYHIVAEINDSKNKEVAEMIAPEEVVLVYSEELIARLIAQTCRQSGLSIVYNELLDFAGSEIYFHEEPGLTSRTFRDSLLLFEDSTVIGIKHKDGTVSVNPPMNTLVNEKDSIIAISEDDDTIRLSGNGNISINEPGISSAEKADSIAEKTLILGWNKKGCSIIRELDNYLASGSTITIVAETDGIENELAGLKKQVKNQKVIYKQGHITDRKTLEGLGLEHFSHIIILCYLESGGMQEADSKTLITLLHLRNIAEQKSVDFSIVSEMLDIRNKQLAEVTKADDFIISNKLVSALLTQLSENRKLKEVFDDLFDAEGSEIYLKPAINYVKPGMETDFYAVVESAARRNEVAIGYRRSEFAYDADKSYGVVVNPKKSEKVVFDDKDKVIVIAED